MLVFVSGFFFVVVFFGRWSKIFRRLHISSARCFGFPSAWTNRGRVFFFLPDHNI